MNLNENKLAEKQTGALLKFKEALITSHNGNKKLLTLIEQKTQVSDPETVNINTLKEGDELFIKVIVCDCIEDDDGDFIALRTIDQNRFDEPFFQHSLIDCKARKV